VQSPEVFVLGGARTPMIDYVAALKDVSAIELGAVASRAAFERTGVRPEWVDHAVFGNVPQTSADAIYGARHVAPKAGVPVDVPALTVNRLRGSGIQAAVSGAQLIQLGEASLVLTLLLELRRRGSVRGLATACIGGGQGIAAIVEAVK
jgi:acetyl-CoA acetyltransferase